MEMSFLEKDIMDFVIPVPKDVSKEIDKQFTDIDKGLRESLSKYLEDERKYFAGQAILSQNYILL